MLDRLRCAPLLAGWRGAAPVDRGAVVAAVLTVVDTLLSEPSLVDIEINPLLGDADGVVAVDAWATVAETS